MSGSVTFGEVTLLDPWFLLVAPLAVLAVWWRWWRPRAALATASLALFAGLRPTVRQRLVWLPQAGRLLAVLCLAVAMARPVQREVVPMQEEGVDIVLLVDTSSSMTIDDMSQTESVRRIDAARARAEEFAKKRTHDRVGLITFARYAELRCPPTLDEDALAAFLRSVDTVPTNSEYDGTAIGTAVGKAVQVLAKSKAKSKLAVLLTDGENTVVDILPADGAKLAKDAGVRVHTIGLGNGVPGPFGFQKLDFADLRGIAELVKFQMRTFKSGAAKDMGNPFRELTPADEAIFMGLINDQHVPGCIKYFVVFVKSSSLCPGGVIFHDSFRES